MASLPYPRVYFDISNPFHVYSPCVYCAATSLGFIFRLTDSVHHSFSGVKSHAENQELTDTVAGRCSESKISVLIISIQNKMMGLKCFAGVQLLNHWITNIKS